MSYSFQFDYGISGATLYAFLRPYGQQTIWNQQVQAFVVYDNDVDDYALVMTEQATTGTYFGIWPDVLAGYYIFTVYEQVGISPNPAVDTIVGTSDPPSYYLPGDTPLPSDQLFSGVWYAHAASEASLVSDTLYKRAGDTTLVFAMCCCNFPEVAAGQVVTAASWATSSPTGLTIANTDFDDTNVWADFTGGTAGVTYTVTTTVTLSGGSVYVRSGYVMCTTV